MDDEKSMKVVDDTCYVEEITFNNGNTLTVGQSDIVVFVGPNNAGKSQAIKDIFALVESDKATGVVVKSLRCHVGNYEDILKRISSNSRTIISQGHRLYSGIGYSVYDYTIQPNYHESGLGDLRRVYFDYIGTVERLQECAPREQKELAAAAKYPIQEIPENLDFSSRLSRSFREAFGLGVEISGAYSKTLSLRCAESFPTLEGNDTQAVIEHAQKMLKLPAIEAQGDGMKGFVGVMLRVLGGQCSSYMLDEPESFLHPPQARIMGQTIGSILSKHQQAFISTHSESLIKGLLMTCPERLKIVRIEREEAINRTSILESETFNSIWNDPLLVHSNIMQGLFNKIVVVCESDVDCMFYAMIEEEVKRGQGKHSEALYVHCGGKQRLKTVVKALKSLGVSHRVICDIDIINDKKPDLTGLMESCGVEWDESLRTAYSKLTASFCNDTGVKVSDVRHGFEEVLASCNNDVLSGKEIDKLMDLVRKDSRIGNIKKFGKAAIPHGDPSAGYECLEKRLAENNIFLVPVGELEGFVPDAGGHGGRWLFNVVEMHPDMSDHVYDQVKAFVTSWKI